MLTMLRQRMPVDEHAATGETARIYHDIRQTLRVSGVNLNFRTWAGFGRFFPLLWDVMREIAASRAFEAAADDVRAEAVRRAFELPPIDAADYVVLGDSQQFHIKAALELYHYINPKLLVFTAIVATALERPSAGTIVPVPDGRVPRGVPAAMFPMEMVDERPTDRNIQSLFDDIKKTMQLTSINSDYRTLAMWPRYVEAAWRRLKPLVRSPSYIEAASAIRSAAAAHAGELVQHVALDRTRAADAGEDVDAIIETTTRFEWLLPPLILNIAMISRDWWPADRLQASPFPLGARS
jgi:hypothetical protein